MQLIAEVFLLLLAGACGSADVRITDSSGRLASAGLLQVRTDLGFGSVCGLNQAAAQVACRQLGFRFGSAATTSCGFYGGDNLCGAPGTPVAKKALRCSGGERTLDNCAWSVPDVACADHSSDAVVFCSNAGAGSLIADGTARLLDGNAPSLSGSGRLEVFHAGAWGSVCSSGFSGGSAAVACKSMGYDGVVPSAAGGGCGQNCGTQPPTLSALACTGSERNLMDCGFEDGDIFCAPEDAVLVACAGEGDATGGPTKEKAPASTLHGLSFLAVANVAPDAGYSREQLQPLSQFRSQHHKTIDGRLCAAAFVQDRQTYTGCTDATNPAGESGRQWCYVEAQLLNQSPAAANWAYCSPTIDYDSIRAEAAGLFADKVKDVRAYVTRLQKAQRAAEQELDRYAKACGTEAAC